VLITAGAARYSFSASDITQVIILLLWILIFSYRQTIAAYPKGGAHTLSPRTNLGTIPGLVAGVRSSLRICADCFSERGCRKLLRSHLLCLGFMKRDNHRHIFAIMVIMLMNLKGVKESGLVFSVPAFVFIFVFVLMVCFGYYRFLHRHLCRSCRLPKALIS
jgi:hypothetical protein